MRKDYKQFISFVLVLSCLSAAAWGEDLPTRHPAVETLKAFLNQLASISEGNFSNTPKNDDSNPILNLQDQSTALWSRPQAQEIINTDPRFSSFKSLCSILNNIMTTRERWIQLFNRDVDLVDKYNSAADQYNARHRELINNRGGERWWNPFSWGNDSTVRGTAMGDVFVGDDSGLRAASDRLQSIKSQRDDIASRMNAEERNLRDLAQKAQELKGSILKDEVLLIEIFQEKFEGKEPDQPTSPKPPSVRDVLSDMHERATTERSAKTTGLEAAQIEALSYKLATDYIDKVGRLKSVDANPGNEFTFEVVFRKVSEDNGIGRELSDILWDLGFLKELQELSASGLLDQIKLKDLIARTIKKGL